MGTGGRLLHPLGGESGVPIVSPARLSETLGDNLALIIESGSRNNILEGTLVNQHLQSFMRPPGMKLRFETAGGETTPMPGPGQNMQAGIVSPTSYAARAALI